MRQGTHTPTTQVLRNNRVVSGKPGTLAVRKSRDGVLEAVGAHVDLGKVGVLAADQVLDRPLLPQQRCLGVLQDPRSAAPGLPEDDLSGDPE